MIVIELVIIAAVAENGVIGKDDGMPWHYSEELKHFKETTMDSPVIMGRVTYESIVQKVGGPLPGRTNIVLSHDELDVPEDVVNVHGIDAAVEAARATGTDEAFVAGGASVYRQFLERGLVDRMILTEIPEEPEGDTFFPDWDDEEWTVAGQEQLGELDIVTYEPR